MIKTAILTQFDTTILTMKLPLTQGDLTIGMYLKIYQLLKIYGS